MFKKIVYSKELMLFFLFIILFIVFSLGSEYFFSVGNIVELFAQMVELGFLTFAMSASLISGGMDLSIGAIASLSTVVIATILNLNFGSPVLAVIISLTVSVLCGIINGVLVAYLNITSMLATLGTTSLFTGLGLVISKGMAVSFDSSRFVLFGRYRIFGVIPFQIVLFLIVAAIIIFIFKKTKWSRRVYQIGSNLNAAKYLGIDYKKDILYVYILNGLLSFLCSIVIASRISSGRADVVNSKVLMTVCASVLGGVSTLGGVGTMFGAFLGVMIVSLLANGFDMMTISRYFQQITLGIILIITLILRSNERRFGLHKLAAKKD